MKKDDNTKGQESVFSVQTVATQTAEVIVDKEGNELSIQQAIVKILAGIEELNKKLG